MERDLGKLTITLSPSQFADLCRCVKDDFEAYYAQCQEEPFEDHSEELDRMEEDLSLIQAALPAIESDKTEFAIQQIIADFKAKIREVA